MNGRKTFSYPAFTLIVVMSGAGAFAAEPRTMTASASPVQSPARLAPKVDEANRLCLQLIQDPINATVMARLEELGDAVVVPMLAQVKGLTEYWRSEDYIENYIIRKSVTARDSRPDSAGVVTTFVAVPRLTPGEMAFVFMAKRLSELGTIEALPLLRTALAANESLRAHARPPIDAAIAKLAAQASTGNRIPPPSPAPGTLPSRPPATSPTPTSAAKAVAQDRPPCGSFSNGIYRNPAVGLDVAKFDEGWQHDLVAPRVILIGKPGLPPCVPNYVGAWNRVEVIAAKASVSDLISRGTIMAVGSTNGLYDLITLRTTIYPHMADTRLAELMQRGVLEAERSAARQGYQGGKIDEYIAPVGTVPVSFTLLKSSALMGRNLYTMVLQRYCNRTLTVVSVTSGSEAVVSALPWGQMLQFSACADQQPSDVPPSRLEMAGAVPPSASAPSSRIRVDPGPTPQTPPSAASSSAVAAPPTAPAPPPASDAWLSGGWNGIGRQGDMNYTVRLTVRRNDELVGADVGYPSLNCSAKWTRQSGSERVVVFRQQIIQGSCLDSWVRLEWIDGSQARFSGHRSLADCEAGTSPVVVGVIKRN